MYAATMGPNVKWGHKFPNGGLGTTAPPLATTLVPVRIGVQFTAAFESFAAHWLRSTDLRHFKENLTHPKLTCLE